MLRHYIALSLGTGWSKSSFRVPSSYRVGSSISRRCISLSSPISAKLSGRRRKLPITQEMRDGHRFWKNLWLGRKQRRSRAGARLKTLLKHFLAGMVAGHCDLDLLLDPFFLHFPRVRSRLFAATRQSRRRARGRGPRGTLAHPISLESCRSPWQPSCSP
jgi:hypothetical protein